MQASYDCPDCNRVHDEPASARSGVRFDASTATEQRLQPENETVLAPAA